MPFVDRSSEADRRGGVADAIAHDVIVRLAKLRSMFVIAQGSTFALRDRGIGPEEAGRMLNVDYVVSGAARRAGRRLTVNVDLIETRTARIIWADVFDDTISDTLDVLDEIGDRIVASVAHEIEMVERNRAILKPPASLDAWEAHHRGLWHMYRFSKTDNERARQFFSQAVELDPTFARAYAGLSFAHFQNAFLGLEELRPGDRTRLRRRRQEPDGRRSRSGGALGHGTRVVAARRPGAVPSPNSSAPWTFRRTSPRPTTRWLSCIRSPAIRMPRFPSRITRASSRPSIRCCSPCSASRAMSLARLGEYDEAAEWAIKAAARPNAHQHIMAIAALILGLAGRVDEADIYKAKIRERVSNYAMADFLAAFRYSPDATAMFKRAGALVGIK